MSVYLVGNTYTETLNGAETITSIPSNTLKKVSNNIVTIAINGGPGTGKGSFEGAVIKELTKNDKNNVVILVAESARDIINQLVSENTLQQTIKEGKLGETIATEQKRRRVIADELKNTLDGKNIYVIYDRDESNKEIYDAFYKFYNFQNETLNEDSFIKELKQNPNFTARGKDMRQLYDVSYCLKPVNHEINYACAAPKIQGAKTDKTRSESYIMAKVLHNALEIGAKMIFSKKLHIVENTDDPNIPAQQTITQRAQNVIHDIETLMETRKLENNSILNFYRS